MPFAGNHGEEFLGKTMVDANHALENAHRCIEAGDIDQAEKALLSIPQEYLMGLDDAINTLSWIWRVKGKSTESLKLLSKGCDISSFYQGKFSPSIMHSLFRVSSTAIMAAERGNWQQALGILRELSHMNLPIFEVISCNNLASILTQSRSFVNRQDNNEDELYPKDISLVFQGPVSDCTEECLSWSRSVLPDSEIIFSTWRGEKLSHEMLRTVDKIVFNEDIGPDQSHWPIGINMPINTIPPQPFQANCNRQNLSSMSGVKQATRSYCMKIRSDMKIVDQRFIETYLRISKTKRLSSFSIFDKPVMTLPFGNLLYFLSDHIFFGKTSDIFKIFDTYSYNNFANSIAEQHIFTSIMKKYMGCESFINISSEKGFLENVIYTCATLSNFFPVLIHDLGVRFCHNEKPHLTRGNEELLFDSDLIYMLRSIANFSKSLSLMFAGSDDTRAVAAHIEDGIKAALRGNWMYYEKHLSMFSA